MRRSAFQRRWVCTGLAAVLLMATVTAGTRVEIVMTSKQAEHTGRLRVGQTMMLEGTSTTLTFAEVRGDSRCPKDARCVRAGEAVVALQLRDAGDPPSTLTLHVPPGGGATETLRDWRIEIVSLDPQTEVGVNIEATDYVVTVRVRRS